MDELIFAGNKYISSKRASKLAGYTADYIGQMCRGGKMDCKLVGRNWYINEIAIVEQKKNFKKDQISRARQIEYKKIELEPMYYSSDNRSNYPEINKIIHKDIKKEEMKVIPISMIKKPAVNIERYKSLHPQRVEKQIMIRQSIIPRQTDKKFPMILPIASAFVLIGILFIAGTFTLKQVLHYSSKDKTNIDTSFQLANIQEILSLFK